MVFLVTAHATGVDSVFGIRQPDWLHWNWIGKSACLATIALLEIILPVGSLRKSGMLRMPVHGSWKPVLLCLVVCAVVGGSAALAPNLETDAETLVFQALMPSVTEEPVFRVMIPVLLMQALGSPWKLGKAQMGWWWLATSMLFAAGHAIGWSHVGGFHFETVPFVFTGIVALWFGWLAVRCGSIWPCLLGHTLLNATGRAIVAISRLV